MPACFNGAFRLSAPRDNPRPCAISDVRATRLGTRRLRRRRRRSRRESKSGSRLKSSRLTQRDVPPTFFQGAPPCARDHSHHSQQPAARYDERRRRGTVTTVTEAEAWRRRRRGARRWRWCAAVAQRRSSARWKRRHESGAVMEAPIGPLRAAWARRRPPVEATRRARRRQARARATDSAAAHLRPRAAAPPRKSTAPWRQK